MKNLLFLTVISCIALSGCKKNKDLEDSFELSVSSYYLTFPVADETQTFDLQSNTDWTISGYESVEWITVSPASGTGDETVSVAVSVNLTAEYRYATLTLTAQGAASVTVSVSQQAATILKINSFEPASARYDETLTIRGEKFDASLTGNAVRLNGITPEIISATTTEIKVKVPKNTNCSGLIAVTTEGQTVVSATEFAYILTNIVSTTAGNGTRGFTNGTGVLAQFNNPAGISVDESGNVYIADPGNHCIRKITPSGEVSTLAGNGSTGFIDGTGNESRFASPNDVAVDASGNIFVADRDNNCIRKITATGEVSTFAGNKTAGFVDGESDVAQFNEPYSVTINALDILYVADFKNHRIRKITPAGKVSTLAGSGESGFGDGTGILATFNNPYNVAVDASNNVYVVDEGNNRIRKITSSGVVTTIAGSTRGFANGINENALFNRPCGIAVDASGNLYVTDIDNQRIRKIVLE